MQRPRNTKPAPNRAGSWWAGLPLPAKIAIVVVALLVLAWALRPSRFAKVANLDSGGSTIVAFGDSLTAGYGAGESQSYPAQLSAMIGQAVVNAGVSGDTTEAASARIDTDVLARDPRIVIVGLGGNDFLRQVPIGTTEANLRGIVQKIHRGGAAVVILGFNFPTLGPSYVKMYARVASEEGCLLVPGVLDGILRNASLKSDEIHPNGRGYALMAERVAGPLKKLIAKADASR